MSADGKISTLCIPRHPAMAGYARNAFSGDWQWQYSCAVRSRASIRGKIPPRCVPGRQSGASFALHASRKRPRAGKSPVRGKIRAPCIRNELALARYARHASEKPRKPPFGNARREDLARKGSFRCTGPSNHARRANLAKTSSFWIHGGDVLPLRGVIFVRGLLENTWRSFIAMVRHCRMHCAPFDSRLARHCSAERRRGRKTLALRVRPATMTAASAGNRGTVEQRRRCPPEVASLLGGIGAIR